MPCFSLVIETSKRPRRAAAEGLSFNGRIRERRTAAKYGSPRYHRPSYNV